VCESESLLMESYEAMVKAAKGRLMNVTPGSDNDLPCGKPRGINSERKRMSQHAAEDVACARFDLDSYALLDIMWSAQCSPARKGKSKRLDARQSGRKPL